MKCRTLLTVLPTALLSLALAAPAAATSTGITTLSFGAMGCNTCHAGGTAPVVSLTGSTSVAPSSTTTYTLQINNPGSQQFGGLNVSAAIGVLSTGGGFSSGTKTLAGTGGRAEITHSAPKAAVASVTTFTFRWTAPGSFSSVILKSWGNAVDGLASPLGDQAAPFNLTVFSSQPGGNCSSGTECLTGFCVDGVCCNSSSCSGGQACNITGNLGTCASGPSPTPTLTPTRTPTVTPSPTPPMHDSVVVPIRPVSITIAKNKDTGTKKIRVNVRNVDPTSESFGHSILLNVSSDCPGGTVDLTTPDFAPPNAVNPILLKGGRSKAALVAITAHSTLTSVKQRGPIRCTLTFTAVTQFPGNTEPSPANNVMTVELNIVDKNDPEQTTALHETVLRSLGPLKITVPKGATTMTTKAKPAVINADATDTTGDSIQVDVDAGHPVPDRSDCPNGGVVITAFDMDTRSPGETNSVSVPAKATRTGLLLMTVDATKFPMTPNGHSPARCTAYLEATGPSSTDDEPTNNVTKMVIDVIDKNDLP